MSRMMLIEKILEYADIDTRLAMKAPPRRLPPNVGQGIFPRRPFVYLKEARSLHHFYRGFYIVQRPFDFVSEGPEKVTIYSEDSVTEIVTPCGEMLFSSPGFTGTISIGKHKIKII